MDEAQVLALITTALGEFEAKVTGVIDQKNSGLAASIARDLKKLTDKPADPTPADPAPQPKEAEEGKLTLKALQQQLKEQTTLLQTLQTERDNERKTAFAARSSAALTDAIATAGTLNQTALRKLLSLDFGEGLKEEGGNWFVQQGESVKPLKDAVSAYLATDEGKAFLPPSGTAGAGSSESKQTTPPPADANLKSVDAFAQAF